MTKTLFSRPTTSQGMLYNVGTITSELVSVGSSNYAIFRYYTGIASYFYSFVYSSLNYGIIVWGTATQNQLHEINVRMNNLVRTITWNKKFSHVTHLYKKLHYLKLNDIYHLKLAKFMHKICNNKLLFLFQQPFNKIE